MLAMSLQIVSTVSGVKNRSWSGPSRTVSAAAVSKGDFPLMQQFVSFRITLQGLEDMA